MADDVLTDSEVLSDETPEVILPVEDTVEEEIEDETEEPEEKPQEMDDDKPFPFERPSLSEVKEKFPTLFKEFPIIRDIIFQETEYRKLFPTIDDAKDAVEDTLAYSSLRDSVLSGKADDLLDAVIQTDAKAAERFSTSFLSTLHKKNPDLYVQTITPVFENFVRQMYRSSDENVRNAAIVAAMHLFGDDARDLIEGRKTFSRSLEETPEEKKIKQEREEFENSKLNEFRGSVNQEMLTGMVKLISRGLDPDNTMSEKAKKILVNDILQEVDRSLAADAQHMKVMNARWMRVGKEGLNTASKEKLVSAYLSRAKQVIPSIRDKTRNEFLGIRKKSSDNLRNEIDNKSQRTKEVTSGRGSGNGVGKGILKPSRETYRRMSDIDILNS
jgi:hypothetical protein